MLVAEYLDDYSRCAWRKIEELWVWVFTYTGRSVFGRMKSPENAILNFCVSGFDWIFEDSILLMVLVWGNAMNSFASLKIRRIPFLPNRESSHIWDDPRLEFTAKLITDLYLWTIFLHLFYDIPDGFLLLSESRIQMIEFFEDFLGIRWHRREWVRRWCNRRHSQWFFRVLWRRFSWHWKGFLLIFLRFLRSWDHPRCASW